ncbi:hypothetical protein NS331_17075, partial [Pseudacidovorax intermedius]
GAQGLPRGARVRLRLGDIDEIALAVSGSVIERLDAEAAPAADEADEEEPTAGALTIAVDVNDAEPEAAASASPAA